MSFRGKEKGEVRNPLISIRERGVPGFPFVGSIFRKDYSQAIKTHDNDRDSYQPQVQIQTRMSPDVKGLHTLLQIRLVPSVAVQIWEIRD